MVKIYVDADACPVKKEVERIAIRHNLETFLVCDGGIRPSTNPLIKNIFVNQGADAADDWIVNNIERANICVTNDIPLAGRCLKRGAFVIKPNGDIYDTNNIGMALAIRKIMEEKRFRFLSALNNIFVINEVCRYCSNTFFNKSAFADVCKLSFHFESLHSNPSFLVISNIHSNG